MRHGHWGHLVPLADIIACHLRKSVKRYCFHIISKKLGPKIEPQGKQQMMLEASIKYSFKT